MPSLRAQRPLPHWSPSGGSSAPGDQPTGRRRAAVNPRDGTTGGGGDNDRNILLGHRACIGQSAAWNLAASGHRDLWPDPDARWLRRQFDRLAGAIADLAWHHAPSAVALAFLWSNVGVMASASRAGPIGGRFGCKSRPLLSRGCCTALHRCAVPRRRPSRVRPIVQSRHPADKRNRGQNYRVSRA